MNNSARKVIPMKINTASVVRTGSVISIISDVISINLAGEIKKATKAFSCLIDVQINDIVICTENENGIVYVLGIQERPGSKKMNISFPDDTNIQSNDGSLSLQSSKSVSIVSNNVNCFSKKIIHKSKEATISYDNITANGNELHASFKTVRLISNLINTMAKQVIDKFIGYVRSTEDNDMVKAGHINRQAEGLLSMDSKHTIMNSKKSTKIDGEKILMG
ncbi:MAG: DUF3540 domain-containing protein [Desulfobacteraceae bacterium]|nr:DUF3540 domain-containing protein [Desulfobacteraceae bacterium]